MNFFEAIKYEIFHCFKFICSQPQLTQGNCRDLLTAKQHRWAKNICKESSEYQLFDWIPLPLDTFNVGHSASKVNR